MPATWLFCPSQETREIFVSETFPVFAAPAQQASTMKGWSCHLEDLQLLKPFTLPWGTFHQKTLPERENHVE
ncbi:hypothetical protein [Deinococcus cellulosilyticus]|uniref:hypothetical protein n=1 Tax=Deinococcus cellulosilyticus TaxID=401558 RepID=UPI0011BE9D24|nr:hypothetical protein [Deinococcus cellulosilyticus]